MLDLTKRNERLYAFGVTIDSRTVVVVAPDFGSMLRTVHEWWRTDPECADDTDEDIDRLIDEVRHLGEDVVIAGDVELSAGGGRVAA